MLIDSLSPVGSLPRLQPLVQPSVSSQNQSLAGGFSAVLNGILGANQQATVAADAAIRDLATGNAQDLHTVSLAVAQADLSFRLILELRNRLTEAYQEVTRMQL
jgi:flagellar hook-basal body complex protein FliE